MTWLNTAVKILIKKLNIGTPRMGTQLVGCSTPYLCTASRDSERFHYHKIETETESPRHKHHAPS